MSSRIIYRKDHGLNNFNGIPVVIPHFATPGLVPLAVGNYTKNHEETEERTAIYELIAATQPPAKCADCGGTNIT